MDKKEGSYSALLGLLGITFHQWPGPIGLLTSKASPTAWIVATTAVSMALPAWRVLKQGLGWDLQDLVGLYGRPVVVSDGNSISISIGKFGVPYVVRILVRVVTWAVFSMLPPA